MPNDKNEPLSFNIEDHIRKRDPLDVRTLLLFNITVSLLLLYAGNFAVLLASFCVSLSVMLFFKMWKVMAKYCTAFVIMQGFVLLSHVEMPYAWLKAVIGVLGFLGYMTSRLLPLIMVAHTIIKKIPSSTLVYALRKMHFHKGFVLSLTVALRFLPTARQEFVFIRESMRMRGIELTAKNFFKNPGMIIEYSLVPILFRSVKISEEMTAAAMVKGVECECRKTNLSNIKMTIFDWLFILFSSAFLVSSFYWNQYFDLSAIFFM
ncbi:MAG: hypothetical protein CR988_07855 [Treponema sp.]|nr:MAG: hypothetical protein CR988_07855 [Treponema sp.]